MSPWTLPNGEYEAWIHRNVEHKRLGGQLLTLCALRGNHIQAHWLRPGGDIVEEDLRWDGMDFPSLTPHLPEVAWDEREMHDLFGYVPHGHPDLRPLIRTPRWPEMFFPLHDTGDVHPRWMDTEPDNPSCTVEGEGVTVMKVGPTHAGIIESGHFVFSIIGENVLYLDVHLFQNHRGVEKSLENLTVDQARPVVSRICGADAVSHQYNFVSAVEHIAGRDIPEAIRWQRIFLLESERILSHLNDLAQIPAGVGFQVASQRGLAMKENWQRGLMHAFGHRFLFDTISFDLLPKLDVDVCRAILRTLEHDWIGWRKLVDNHLGFHDRMQGVGVVRRDDAVRLGAVGVALRATGLAQDVRLVMPLYDGVRVEVARAEGGDVEARFQIRLQEVERSIQLLRVALRHLDIKDQSPPWHPKPDLNGQAVTFSESPHGLNAHFVKVARGRIVRYHVRSGAFRNWPVVTLAVAGNMVADFPLINKSFELCYSCVDR